MAGSYYHVVTDDGNLGSPEMVSGMLENGGDVYEAVEEMYGMIWQLAYNPDSCNDPGLAVENARRNYREGLKLAKRTKTKIKKTNQ